MHTVHNTSIDPRSLSHIHTELCSNAVADAYSTVKPYANADARWMLRRANMII